MSKCEDVSRAQMTIFLLRTKDGASCQPLSTTGTMFTDVTLTTGAAAWIEQLAREGTTRGPGWMGETRA